MEWVRGEMLGRGSFGTVSLASPKSNSKTQFVVKSCDSSYCSSLQNEKQILSELHSNHSNNNIIRCLGDSLSFEKNTRFYNLFLEYASKGSLCDQLKRCGGKFESFDVKRYTKSILKGLSHIHQNGFVHCDIKLQNILLFDDDTVKIADFGLSRRVSDDFDHQLRGTPLFMSPEIVAGENVEAPADIWALGCAVIEMFSGKPAWKLSPESEVSTLLYRIAVRGESPNIPGNMCDEGKDFLEKCFLKNPKQRWTAQMLLDHPFVSGLKDEDQRPSVSPRCPFEFPDWQSSSGSDSDSDSVSSFGFSDSSWTSTQTRTPVSQLLTEYSIFDQEPDWSDSGEWIAVR